MEPELVSEADGAFYAFAGVMLALYVVPATCFTIYRVLTAPKKLRSRGFAVHVAFLSVACGLLGRCLWALQSVDTSGVFDPYEILGISDTATSREIKKAFRALGRQLHPDKNLANPLATSQFARVTKAYEALTNPQSIENYRKYGHPDGRQSMLMDVAFASAFSGSNGGTGSVFMLVYFGGIFAGVVYLVYWLQKSAGRWDRTQISRATRTSFVDALTEKMSVHDVVELLLSCDEMAGAGAGMSDSVRNETQLRAKMHTKFAKKMEAAKALPSEVLGRIRKHENPVARENMLALYQYLRREKLRGVSRPLWVDQRFQKVLLELPFLVDAFATIAAKELAKRAYPAIPLLRALSLLSSIAQGSLVPDEVALRDQKERVAAIEGQLPDLCLKETTLVVLDEPTIQPGDWLTLQTTLQRQHLKAGETAPLAATFYDHVDSKSPFRKEHVWFLVVDKGTGRLYSAWKCVDLSQQVVQKVGFLGPETRGKYEFEVRVVCPAYLDVQTKVDLPLVAFHGFQAPSRSVSCRRVPVVFSATFSVLGRDNRQLPRIISEDTLFENPWLRLKRILFLNAQGSERQWTGLERTTTHPKTLSDTIALIDPVEAPEIAAMRELKEETGYMGSRVLHMGPPMVNDQGITNGKGRLLLVEVQEEEQQIPLQQHLEQDEIIQVVHAPLKDLVKWLEGRKRMQLMPGCTRTHWDFRTCHKKSWNNGIGCEIAILLSPLSLAMSVQ
ncbi:unnamed protein product [Peronospora farinosa]|uniref:J domain-containing protein n=1 Tax=Peronospora farinosa TaxID=134698 RepID=A0ABN8C7H0_9STRA|nr:unnamed protein product [Peronospora farinosa]